tara:strand:- start:248 stop:1213 length:966 start_codon:yes stop_codon:yes gene_type:complete
MLRATALRALSGALASTSARSGAMRSFATGGASRATGGRPGDDDGHDPFGDCTSSGWEGTEGADADADAAGGSTARTHATTHDDGWEANFEDLMAMEDSYGSGVEDLSTAAMEMANARMAEQKRLQEEMRRLRGIQPGDRVRVRVRHGAPYPDPIKRYHYTSPFGGAGLGHDPSARGKGATAAAAAAAADDDDVDDEGGGGGERRGIASKGDAATGTTKGDARRWKIVVEIGYVVCTRGDRVGVKRNGHPEDTDESFPTYPKSWVEVLNVGEMWDIKTGPRNLGAFASEEDYAQAQAAWAEATNFGNDAGAPSGAAKAAER